MRSGDEFRGVKSHMWCHYRERKQQEREVEKRKKSLKAFLQLCRETERERVRRANCLLFGVCERKRTRERERKRWRW